MKEQITIISDELNHGILTEKEAQTKLLALFGTSDSDLLPKARQMQLEQQHKIDSHAEHYTEHEIGTLNGIKRIVSLIERHHR